MSSGDESLDGEIESEPEITEEVGGIIEEVGENFIEQAAVDNEEVNEPNTENQQENETENKTVKPKRVIKNPQPKLNEQTLQGPKGLSAIQSYFDRVKFKGRGHEEHDLNVLMKTYEYWCHRLFPKFPFDDSIARLEKLGTKRGTQTQVKRIRMGLELLDPEKPVVSDEEENNTSGFVDTYNDQFDQLLPSTSNEPEPEVTEEQMERIRQNKERAQRLREERLRKIKEKAQNSLERSNQLVAQSSQLSMETPNIDICASSSSSSHNDINRAQDENKDEDVEIGSILDFINSDEKSKSNHKKNILESDSEDGASETSKETARKVNVRRHILESDEDEEISPQNENNACIYNKITDTDEDDDIENILTEINTDNNIATTNVNRETKINNCVSFQNNTQNATGDSDKENLSDTNKGPCNINQQENGQNIETVRNKLDKNKVSTVSEKNDSVVLDNSNILTIENGNEDTSLNEVQAAQIDVKNTLNEINLDDITQNNDLTTTKEYKGNKTLHTSQGGDTITALENSENMGQVFNDIHGRGNETNQNEAEAVESSSEKHSAVDNDGTNVHNLVAAENKLSATNETKNTEYTLGETEELMRVFNDDPDMTINTNKEVPLIEPMDTTD